MKENRKKKSSVGVIIALLGLIVILVLILFVLTKGDFGKKVKADVGTKVAKMAIEQAIKTQTGESVDIDQVIEKMDTQDAQTVNEMIEKYADEDIVSGGVEALKSGDLNTVKDYVKENVDTQDIEQMLNLYEKYKNDFTE